VTVKPYLGKSKGEMLLINIYSNRASLRHDSRTPDW